MIMPSLEQFVVTFHTSAMKGFLGAQEEKPLLNDQQSHPEVERNNE